MSRKYKDQFEIKPLKTPNGFARKAVYHGDYYSTAIPNEELVRYKAALKSVSVAAAVLYAGMGFINNSGSRVFYVVLPYAVLFLPIAFLVISTISFGRLKDMLTFPEYDKTYVRIKTTAIAAFILAVAGVAGELFFILSGKSSTMGLEIIFICGFAAIAFLAFLSIQIHKKVQYIKVEKTGAEAAED